ncbi:MAG: alpha/beta fold hydrolase [Rhizomicrobium sp.]
MREASAVFPHPESGLGLQSLAREMEAFAASAFRPPPPLSESLPRGDGHAVLVLPGFLAGDWTTQRLRDVIAQLNYRAEAPEIFFNAGPTRQILVRLNRKLLDLAEISGAKVSIVGISLGGVLARQLALDNAEAVRCVVTLCSPIRYPVVTPLQPFAQALTPFHESSWLDRRGEIGGALPVPVTAIYSEEDGIIDWRQCLQDDVPGHVNVQVGGAHTTIGSNPDAHAAVAHALSANIA